MVAADAERLTEVLQQVLREQQPAEEIKLEPQLIDNVQESLAANFDPAWGGFGYSDANPQYPKFPSPPDLMFLIEQARGEGAAADAARGMLTLTLDKMAQGGIRDHLGGGFHRYSVDRFWHIPHFEKMLYDNGQLATVYAETYALTGDETYRRVLVELLDFVLDEMTDEAGAFYAAIDADSEGEEGKFYRWTKEELDEALSGEDRQLMADVYQLGGEPNFEDEYFVPILDEPKTKTAKRMEITVDQLEDRLAPLRQKLFDIRNDRKRPLTDTKILTAWNGLMIRGFADAGRILDDSRYITAAQQSADFVLDQLTTEDGRLLRTYREGEAKLNAYLDDYAFLAEGLLALHRASGERRWLEAADRLTAKQIELFWDEEAGGFFFTSGDHETLIARAKKRTDGVMPSGNSVAASNLLYLADTLDKPAYRKRAAETLQTFAAGMANQNQASQMTQMAIALNEYLLESSD